MFGWIRNIRVSTKLALGFGLVLALSLILVVTGWVAVNTLTSRGVKVQSIARISDMTMELRVERVRMELNPNGNSAQIIRKILDKMATHLNDARALLMVASDEALIDQQKAAVRVYRDALNRVGEPGVDLAPIFARMSSQGDVLLDTTRELIASQASKRDADSVSAKSLLLTVAVLALLLSVCVAWVITRQIVTPLQRALLDVDRIASGDLSSDVKVDRRDELGQLQTSLREMTASLRHLIGGISGSVVQIASAAEELSAVTKHTSAGVNSQRAETDHVATAMNEMASTVQEVARSAEEASEAAILADRQAREGERVVGDAIQQIERLAVEVGSSAEAVSHLKEQSDKIGGVLDVIKAVAQQTNLLALNAAIEAARAGEAGRGFAVVADEVRGLALRTQQSTEEIENLVAGVQSGTHAVASGMEASLMLSEQSVEFTRKAGNSLEDITRAVSTIQLMNQQIAAAAEQQSAVAEEINRSVISVRDISEQTASASDQTASSSVELARLGHELEGLVSRFKV